MSSHMLTRESDDVSASDVAESTDFEVLAFVSMVVFAYLPSPSVAQPKLYPSTPIFLNDKQVKNIFAFDSSFEVSI